MTAGSIPSIHPYDYVYIENFYRRVFTEDLPRVATSWLNEYLQGTNEEVLLSDHKKNRFRIGTGSRAFTAA